MAIVELILKLILSIVKIIQEKGDDAGDVRLKDIDGFRELKAEAKLHADAVRAFREKIPT
jgi:hypothetical protein